MHTKSGLADLFVAENARDEAAAKIRLVRFAKVAILGDFNYAQMKAIHRAIFQDVYECADPFESSNHAD